MKKYQKKPVIVEAIQINSFDYDEMCEIVKWCNGLAIDEEDYVIAVPTLEGRMMAKSGDWIIKGIQGEFYPCKPDIFEASYMEISE